MKKIVSLLMCFILLLCFTACKEDKNNVKHELPFEGNAAYLPYEEGRFSSQFDDEAEALRNEILNLKDSKPQTAQTYYVSYKGNDDNDGLSPETAWKTLQWVNYMVEPMSAVLFERGGVYRGNITLKSNVFYGAYGEGQKPCIYGSLRNYADESLWTKYNDNIWKIEFDNETDVGNVIFDHGKVSATRVFNADNLSRDYAYVSSGNKLYLYLSQGNPASVHNDIEITVREPGAVLKGGSKLENVTIENLCIKYGNFGISIGAFNKGITVRGCEIGYIGGCIMTDNTVRWGNGIELWGGEDIVIDSCWVYQCYDAGVTHQSQGGENVDHKNVKINNNLLEFSQYNIEVWNKEGMLRDIYYTNNILRFAGYQVFDPKSRHGSDSSYTSHICNLSKEDVYNFNIENNIFDTSYGYLIHHYNSLVNYKNNSYLQQTQQATYFFEEDTCKILPSLAKVKGKAYQTLNQEQLEAAVKIMDKSPKAVIFENK